MCSMFQNRLALSVGTGITAYSLHPGVIHTELSRHLPYFDTAIVQTLAYYLTWPLFKEPWYGAQTTVFCAVDENLENESGKYYRFTILYDFRIN